WRAVVTIHAPGFGGWPSDGQRATATVNASWPASSAASMSPRKRIRVATQRPYSRRKTASTVTTPGPTVAARGRSQLAGRARRQELVDGPHFERGELDWLPACDCGLLGPLQGRVQVGDVDDPESAQVLLSLGVRPVGNQEVSTGLAHHGRRLRRQAALEHEHAGVPHLGVERGHIDAQPLKLLRGRHLVGVVEREQVLRHERSLPFVIRGRSLPGPHSRYEVATAESTLLLPTMPENFPS